MNKPIRTIAIFCLFLFLLLMANATYLQFFQAEELNTRAENRRVVVENFSRERGAITVGREVIAESRPSDDEFQFQRTYPKPLLYAPVTGYFSYEYGTRAIEQSENPVLSGEDDRLFVTRLVDMVNNNQPKGGRVQLTLDPVAQKAAYDALKGVSPGVRGAVVAIEPGTGKILAMVSLPSYDPNLLASHDFDAVRQSWNKLTDEEQSPGTPMLNRSVQTRLPPGSTFKVVTAAAALENGLVDNADGLVPGGETYQLPQSSAKIGNGGRSCGSDRIPLRQALEQSCNTTFLALADELGSEKMAEQAEKFGFNEAYLKDFPNQAESVYPTDGDAPQTALTGIGQWNVSATPLQMAMVMAGVANDGVVMRPYIVDEVLSSDLEKLDSTDSEALSEAMSSDSADALTDALVSTVESGTASPGGIPGVQVAGKTGTAENCDDCSNYAWYTSFAPADDPKVAVAVMIENYEGDPNDIAGGQLGGPVAKAVMEAVIR